MALVDSFNPLVNFWERHPQQLIQKTYKDFFEEDKSEKKVVSSRIMWAIALVYDYESEYAPSELEKRIMLVEKEYLESPGFFEKFEDKLRPLIDLYMENQKDAPRRALTEWEEAMDKRTKFLNASEYDIANGSKLDKMRSETNKLFVELERLKREYLTKKANSNVKGDHKLSLLEERKI